MNTRSELQDVFQDTRIHDTWKSAYRNNPRQDRCNDRMLDRVLGLMGLPHSARVLDAGCGTGEHTIRLAKRGYVCTGVDLSEPALERARRGRRARNNCPRQVDLLRIGGPFPAGRRVRCRSLPRGLDAHSALGRRPWTNLQGLAAGGKIVILESNHRSVEFALVRLVRLFRRGQSQMVRTPGGVEFHLEDSGQAPLTRVTNVPYLIAAMRKHGVEAPARIATEFWDIGRFPAGMARSAAIAFNRLWFSLRLPAVLSGGNAIIGEKT